MEIHRVASLAGDFIIINIMFSVTSAINVAAAARKTGDKINSDAHRAEIRPIDVFQQPLNPIAPSSLVSLGLPNKPNQDTMKQTATCGRRSFRRKEKAG